MARMQSATQSITILIVGASVVLQEIPTSSVVANWDADLMMSAAVMQHVSTESVNHLANADTMPFVM